MQQRCQQEKLTFRLGAGKSPKARQAPTLPLAHQDRVPQSSSIQQKGEGEKSQDELRLSMGFPAARKTLLLFS